MKKRKQRRKRGDEEQEELKWSCADGALSRAGSDWGRSPCSSTAPLAAFKFFLLAEPRAAYEESEGLGEVLEMLKPRERIEKVATRVR